MQLTQKETTLLSDLKNQEKLCVEKYNRNASLAHDPQLKDLFWQIASVEQGHLDTLNRIENSNPPEPSSQSGGQQQPSFNETYGIADSEDKQADAFLCSDLLAAEKHSSHLYDTCVFEFGQENLRKILNHIQSEEQEHGKLIYDYMSKNSMYS